MDAKRKAAPHRAKIAKDASTSTRSTASAAPVAAASAAASATCVDDAFDVEIQELWVDQFRPHTFEALTFHEDLNERLRNLVATNATRAALPHLLFYGPSGGGKRTRVQCVLNALYRLTPAQLKERQFGHASRTDCAPKTAPRNTDGTVSGVEELTQPRRLCLQLNGTSAASGGGADLFVLRSPFHLELTPSDLGHRDFYVVQQAVKAFVESGAQTLHTYVRQAQTQQQRLASMFGTSASAATAAAGVAASQSASTEDVGGDKGVASGDVEAHDNPRYRVVIVNQADRLTHDAQAALRRTMEAYTDDVRFILVAERIEGVIDPIQSRCMTFRVPLVPRTPLRGGADGAMERTLRYALRQHARYQSNARRVNAFLKNVVNRSAGDMTRAMLLMQCSVANLPAHKSVQSISPENDLLNPDWIDTVKRIVDTITVAEVGTGHMSAARTLMRDLQTHCIPSRSIVWTLYTQLVARLTVEAEPEQAQAASALCGDVAWLCAEYERRSAVSHFYVVHLDALLARLMLAIGLHQRGAQYTDEDDAMNARFRAYDTVEPAARRMRHTHRAPTMREFTRPVAAPPTATTTTTTTSGSAFPSSSPPRPERASEHADAWAAIWAAGADVEDLRELRALCVAEESAPPLEHS